MSLTVLIPVKNESQIIDQTITELENSWIMEIDHEIIFLDDFSSDNTIQKIHNHFCFEFSKSNKLIYNDVRKFGFVKLVKNNEIKTCSHLDFLGPEPLSKKFSKSYLFQEFAKTKKNVKNFLMDQKYVSGIGNIYANEILHVCSINPRKNTRNINIKDASNIIQKTKIILKIQGICTGRFKMQKKEVPWDYKENLHI